MAELGLAFGALILGIVGLVWSADKFIEGAASLARSLGVSTLVVGLTVVSLGTSAPEIVVSVSASLRDAGELAVGNAIGSNIANVALVLAATLLVARLPIQKHILRRELPLLLAVTAIGAWFVSDGQLVPWEGVVLLLLLPPVLAYLAWSQMREMTAEEKREEQALVVALPRSKAIVWFALGLALLIASSEVLVWGAKTLAIAFGVSPLVVGLTLIALGTSLPELAASIASARRGLHDIALGNIIGSNIFNLLAVMALPGIIHSPTMDPEVFSRDYLAMSAVTILLALWAYASYWRARRTGSAGLGKMLGVILLMTYGGYYMLLFTSH